MGREKILVVDSDLDSLSKIYLALIHRKFKVEACNNPQEFLDRLKRFKPSIVVLSLDEYSVHSKKLRPFAIVVANKDSRTQIELNQGDILLTKPVAVEELIKAVERLV